MECRNVVLFLRRIFVILKVVLPDTGIKRNLYFSKMNFGVFMTMLSSQMESRIRLIPPQPISNKTPVEVIAAIVNKSDKQLNVEASFYLVSNIVRKLVYFENLSIGPGQTKGVRFPLYTGGLSGSYQIKM